MAQRAPRRSLAAVIMAGLCAVVAARIGQMGDYRAELLPTMDALLDGDVGQLASGHHLMGPLSILLRLPAVALVDALGGDDLDAYRAGAFLCLLPAAAVGLYLREQILAHGAHPLAGAAVGVLAVVNPAVNSALELGHPEEALTAAFCVGAVLAAKEGRLRLGVVLLVAALLSKQWALLAVPVVLVAAGAAWRRMLAQTVVVTALLAAPVVAADPGRFLALTEHLAAVTDEGSRRWGPVMAQSIWWPVATPEPVRVFDGVETITVEPRRLEEPLDGLSRPLMGVLVLALAIATARSRRHDVLALLAAVFLIRCLFDPSNGHPYHVPLVLAVVAWDSYERTKPTTALLVCAVLWITFEEILPLRDFALTNAIYLGWAVPLAAAFAVGAIRPRPAPS